MGYVVDQVPTRWSFALYGIHMVPSSNHDTGSIFFFVIPFFFLATILALIDYSCPYAYI